MVRYLPPHEDADAAERRQHKEEDSIYMLAGRTVGVDQAEDNSKGLLRCCLLP